MAAINGHDLLLFLLLFFLVAKTVLFIFLIDDLDLGLHLLHLERGLHLGDAQRQEDQIDDEGQQHDGPSPIWDEAIVDPVESAEEHLGEPAEGAEVNYPFQAWAFTRSAVQAAGPGGIEYI